MSANNVNPRDCQPIMSAQEIVSLKITPLQMSTFAAVGLGLMFGIAGGGFIVPSVT